MFLMDGGPASGTNLGSAIEHCRELVDDDSKIIVDILQCKYDVIPEDKVASKNAWTNWRRAKNFHSHYSNLDEIDEQMKAYPNVNYRYLFQ
jgi:hypothetical protein